MEEIAKALDLKAELDTLRPINKEQEARIMQKFRLDWNYHSNHLEGNALTYGETKALILFGITAQGKPMKDALEMTGHNDAIDWVLDTMKGERPLTENFIRELHEVLLVEPYEVDAETPDGKLTKKLIKVGSYKTTPNHVKTKTGEIFYFATPEETPAEMTALMDWYIQKSKEENINPILLAAEFHYKFIRIHPFDDGNGRTARILMNFILMKFGFPPTIIKSDTESKGEYFAVLQLADAGNIEPFINFIAANLIRSLETMIAGANGENIEEPDDLDKEIALLEKRLSGFGEKAKVGKSEEVLISLIDNFVNVVQKKMIDNNSLKKFYLDVELSYFYIDKQGAAWEPGLEIIKNHLYEIENIGIVVNYRNFSTVGFAGFNFKSTFYLEFSFISYNVFVNGVKFFEKPYGYQFLDSEIDKIIKFEITRHKEFIEQKIAEKENNS